MRALIVDDDEPIRVMLATIIKQQGFSVDTASDGGEAIEKLKNGSYHVVLLDLISDISAKRIPNFSAARSWRPPFRSASCTSS